MTDIMREAMKALDKEDAAAAAAAASTDVEDPRADLTPLHRLLLDLGHFSSRYWEIADTTDPEQKESYLEDVGSIFEAFRECASAIDKIGRQYLAEDGSVLPGPVVLIEVEDGAYEVGTYNYPVNVIVIDYDDCHENGDYTEERRAEVLASDISADDKASVLDRLDQSFEPY